MGDVYLGMSPGGRRVAIKVIRPEHVADPEFRVRFQREIKAVQKINTLYTAAIVDFDADAGLPWFATVYLEGVNLQQRVERAGPLPPDEVRQLAAACAEALSAIHRAGVVHRDIKPSNVFLTATDEPRIIDFGIALSAGEAWSTTGVVGTPQFCSPEHFRPRLLGPHSDVYSLGATLFFAATGRAPVRGESLELMNKITRGELELHGLTRELSHIIVPCLALRPGRRPSDDELLELARSRPAHTTRRSPDGSGPHGSDARRGEAHAAWSDRGRDPHPARPHDGRTAHEADPHSARPHNGRSPREAGSHDGGPVYGADRHAAWLDDGGPGHADPHTPRPGSRAGHAPRAHSDRNGPVGEAPPWQPWTARIDPTRPVRAVAVTKRVDEPFEQALAGTGTYLVALLLFGLFHYWPWWLVVVAAVAGLAGLFWGGLAGYVHAAERAAGRPEPGELTDADRALFVGGVAWGSVWLLLVAYALLYADRGAHGSPLNWLLAAAMIATAGVHAGTLTGIWQRAGKDAAHRRERRTFEFASAQRWFGPDCRDAAPLRGLTRIPAARVFCLDDVAHYAAASGSQVALVTLVYWPPGAYAAGRASEVKRDGTGHEHASRDVTEAASWVAGWRPRLPGIDVQGFVMVVGPGVVVPPGPGVSGVRMVTPATAAEEIGEFLAAQPYEMNIQAVTTLIRATGDWPGLLAAWRRRNAGQPITG